MALRFSKLTRPAIRSLSAGERIAEHGIVAERLPSGDVRYSINIMVDRQRVHRVVGRESDGVTREQAERLIEKLRTEAREGRLNLPKGRKVALSFAEAAAQYLAKLGETGGRNIDRKRQQLSAQLTPAFGRSRLDAISDFQVKSFVKRRRDSGAAPSTINRELATLSHLFRSAAGWKWIGRDQVPAIERQREGAGRIVALSREQCGRLLNAAIGDQDRDLWLFVMIGLHTAMRHGEIRRLRWEHFDGNRRRFYIPQAKAGEREQPITADLNATLLREREQRPAGEQWLFTAGPGSHTEYRHTFRKAFRRAVERAGMDPEQITPHVMRHTAISALVKAGVDLPTVQRVSGHKTLAMVLRYSHVDGAHIDAATDALSMPIPGTVTHEFHTRRVSKTKGGC